MAPPEEKKETEEEKRQREAREELERAAGRKPSGNNPDFPLWKKILDQFTDKKTQKADWPKIAVAAVGGIAGGLLAIDAGIVGMGISALLGTALAGTIAVFLFNWLRGDKDEGPAVPPPLPRPHAPDPNKKVLSKSQILMPDVKTMGVKEEVVDVPTYDKLENPNAPMQRARIEELRKIVARGHTDSRVAPNADNWIARALLKQMEEKANQNEINLRWLRDELPKQLQEPAAKAQAYLKKLGPDAEKYLSVKLDPMLVKQSITLEEVPGQFGELTGELEKYGKEIKTRLARELAKLRGVKVEDLDLETKKVMIDTAWKDLNVIAKRNIISNFAVQAIYETLTNPADLRSFFPENETDILNFFRGEDAQNTLKKYTGETVKVDDDKAIYVSFSGLLRKIPGVRAVTGDNEQEKFIEAYKTGNLDEMGAILKRRLKKDDDDRAAGKTSDLLKPEARRKMEIFIMGFDAYNKNLALDKYIQDVLIAKELPALEKFENAIMEHTWHVARVKKRMTAYAQGGSKFLVLDESKVESEVQTFKVLDTRTDKPQMVDIEITYEGTPPGKHDPRVIKSVKVGGMDKTAALKGKLVQAGDIDRFKNIQAFLETPGVLAAASSPSPDLVGPPRPDLVALLKNERDKSPTMPASPVSGAPPSAPPLWKLPTLPNPLGGSDKERE